MKNTVIGILAHVDSGKTTLSEALLYCSGAIGRLGRVDHRDSFLDTYALERDRGITIFSKQALLCRGDCTYYLLDTPGHVDFSAETERTLQVLDYAILVISGTDGVQSHTDTLWRLLRKYRVPCFLFVNKMDLAGAERVFLLNELRGKLGDCCVDFSDTVTDAFFENVALCDKIRRKRPLGRRHHRRDRGAQAVSLLLRLGAEARRGAALSLCARPLYQDARLCRPLRREGV